MSGPTSVTLVVIGVIAVASIFATVAVYWMGPHSQNQNTATATSVSSTTTIVVNGSLRSFAYLEWSQSTPASFTLDNVKFTLWTNTTVTYSGGSCYGPSSGYAGYVITFSDGSKEQITTCTVGPNPPQTVRLTSHANPQAGILIVPSTGQVFFLVGLQTPSGNTSSISEVASNQGAATSHLYQLEFVQESNCPYGSWLVPWGVMINHQTIAQPPNATLPLSYGATRLTGNSTYSTISFSLPSGTYNYSILPNDPLGTEQSGNVTVDGSNVVVQVYAFVTSMGCSSTTTIGG